VSWRYHKIFFIPFQWRIVGAALCLARQLTTKAILGLVLFVKYISAPIALRYGYSDHNTSSPSCFGLKGSVSFSRARTTMGVLVG
jgi:hypothetical protein